jgi:hypothetical protein
MSVAKSETILQSPNKEGRLLDQIDTRYRVKLLIRSSSK